MTEDDEKRLADEAMRIWGEAPNGLRGTVLKIAKAAREFRETGELRWGDEVVTDEFSKMVGKCTYVGMTPYGKHMVYTSNSGLLHADNVKLKPKTELRVKGVAAMAKALEDGGYAPNVYGDFCADDKFIWDNRYWLYCGKQPNPDWEYEPEWLEEVEI